jgi:nucleotide-binding universal stress UspA family protein
MALAHTLGRLGDSELVAATVWERLAEMPNPAYGRWEEFNEAEARRTAEAGGEGVRTEVVKSTSHARGLHDLAEREGADLIVVGSCHHGRVGRALAGTVGVSLLHGSPCAVAVAPRGFAEAEPRLKKIGVGYDGLPEADVALDAATELARAAGARLCVITVALPPESGFEGKGYIQAGREELAAAIKAHMQEVLDRGVSRASAEVETDGQLFSDTQDVLAHRDDIDLMVLGSRAYGPLRRAVIGSNAAQLMRSAPCPAIVFPRGVQTSKQTSARPATVGAER